MSSSAVTSKGQITIPVRVRRELGVESGDRIEFVELAKGQFAIIAATGTLKKLKGLIRKPAKAVSIEEMNAAIIHQASGSRKLIPRK